MNNKGFAPIAVIVLIVIVIGAVSYFVIANKSTTTPSQTSINQTTQSNQISLSSETKDWKTYQNEKYGFEIKHPLNFKETVDTNPAGIFYLYLGYDNTPYAGDISIRVYRNYKNQTVTQYFAGKKLEDSAAYASRCQTCAMSDVDAEFDECMANQADKVEIGGKDAFMCTHMPQRATRISPMFIFHNGYIYELSGFDQNSPYGEYKKILSTFKLQSSSLP